MDRQKQPEQTGATTLHYAGFWIRTGAALVDSVLVLLIIYPVLYLIYGPAYFTGEMTGFLVVGKADFVLSYLMPAIAVIAFWMWKQATPGKMLFATTIVDARTGAPPSKKQALIRYLGYFVSTLPLCLGFLWIAFDPKKQGWHDKLAGTVVVRRDRVKPVRFE